MTSLTLSAVTEPDGTVVGYIGAGEDITERLRVQDALLAALDREHASVLRLEEVDHVKQELVSNVSHELRTPITSIAGYAELLSDGSLGELSEGQVDADRADRAQHHAARPARRGPAHPLQGRVRPARARARRDRPARRRPRRARAARGDGRGCGRSTYAIELPEEPVLIMGDAAALERVVVNLLSNAIKFTPDDGRVTVSVSQNGEGAVDWW